MEPDVSGSWKTINLYLTGTLCWVPCCGQDGYIFHDHVEMPNQIRSVERARETIANSLLV